MSHCVVYVVWREMIMRKALRRTCLTVSEKGRRDLLRVLTEEQVAQLDRADREADAFLRKLGHVDAVKPAPPPPGVVRKTHYEP